MTTDNRQLINRLKEQQSLTKPEWIQLISGRTPELAEYLFLLAREERHRYYGHDVYVRGLIEFTNYCRNDCFYCGIRKSNGKAVRYRLDEEEILSCCQNGYRLGFRTFVLQGGEDAYFTDEKLVHVLRSIKKLYPDCAITLSANALTTASNGFLTPEPTAICCGMRPAMPRIIPSSIRLLCVHPQDSNACGT